MFSSRTNWHRQQNKLSQLLDARRNSGKVIYDLTISNPTDAGFRYPSNEILSALSQPQSLHYSPDPKGMLSAREAVAEYYAAKGIRVQPSDVILTSSTSEAYSFLFKLLCNAGDEVLVPIPSYPLFEFLTQLNDVRIRPYHLRYDGEWHVDFDSVRDAITSSTRAIVVVSPHNPTGMFLKSEEHRALSAAAMQHGLALIVDEVFSEYGKDDRRVRSTQRVGSSTASNSDVLTFTLNGISKLCGLPQLKLGWIVVSGNEEAKNEALHRLEIIADTFLSVNTPVQVALSQLMEVGEVVREQIRERVQTNFSFIKLTIEHSPLSVLSTEGGWYAVLKIPSTKTEEEWALKLLDDAGVYVFPGYFFEFRENGYLVVSLLGERDVFKNGMEAIARIVK